MSEIIKFDAPTPLCEVPAFVGKDGVRFNNCSDGYYMAYIPSVSAEEFADYCKLLESAGYAKTYENTIKDNVFFNYVNSENGVSVYTYRIGHCSEVRVIAGTDVPALPEKKNVKKVCEPMVAQLNSSHEILQLPEGMSYVVRVEDGSFIVIDGGSNEVDAKEIYDYLKYAATDKDNIVIATWYITHAHSDHYCGFEAFAKKYSDDATIKLETVMYNQCYTKLQTQFISETGDQKFKEAMAKYYPSVPVYKPLTGQKYTFSTTTIEILYTMSDFMPKVIPNEADATAAEPKKGDGNVQSMVAMFDIVNNANKKDRLLITGDATKVACDEMTARYKNYLKCDMVQVPHHGHGTDSTDPVQMARRQNGTKDLYKYTNPSIAFWPTSNFKYQERLQHSVNKYLRAVISTNKGKHYIAETSTNTTNTIVFN